MINTTYSFLYSTQLSQITRNGGSVTLTVFQNKLILNGLKRLSLNKMAQKEICFQNTQYVLNWEYSPQSKNLESVSLYKQKRRKYTFCGSNNQLCQLKYFLSGLIPFSDWEREFQFIKHIRKTKQCEVYPSQISQIFVAKNYSNQEKALKNLNLGEPNQELEILKLLKSNPHPNVHGMESYFIDDFKCLVVMEYLNKGTLYEIQKSYKTNVPLEVIKEIMLQILEGLNHLHQLKIIHRDIKFDNIMIQEFKPIKVTLIDFGLSIIGKSTSSRAGTGGYIAPEVFTSCFIDEKSDIFSAGVVMHKLLTCKGIYENLEQNQAGHMHISTHIKDPNALDLLHQMLAKDPKLRYSASDCLGHPFFTEENDSLSSKMNLQNYLSPKGCKLQVNSPSTDFVSNQNIKLFKLN